MAKVKHGTGVSEVTTLSTAKKRTVSVSEDERRGMIAEAAYYLAQQRGFTGGDPTSDWLQAEAQINHMFGPQISITH